jgi:hypothetical protein
MKKHTYTYSTTNNGNLQDMASNRNEFQSLVPHEFSSKTDKFVDTAEDIAIDQFNDNLQQKLRAKPNNFANYNLQYSKYIGNLKLGLANMRKQSLTALKNSEKNVMKVDHQKQNVKLIVK